MPEKMNETLYREFKIQRDQIDEDARTVELSFSSEEPYERYFGTEILDHGKKSVKLDRMKNGANVLVDHDRRDVVGVVEKVVIGDDRKGRASVRFGKSGRAEEIYRDVLDGIRVSVSVGYMVHKWKTEESSPAHEIMRATLWEPMEISLVSVPADMSVGVGRSVKAEETKTTIIEEKKTMAEETKIKIKEVPVVDEKAVQDSADGAKRDETSRVTEILAIGDKFNLSDLAREAIAGGMSSDNFRQKVLDAMANPRQADPPVGMDGKEVEQYSLLRAINAMASQNWDKAGLELEASRAVADQLKKEPQGFFVPRDIGWSARDLTAGTDTAGGFLKGTDHKGDSYVEALRAKMVLQQLGARIMSGLVGDVSIPAANAVTTVYWVAESGAPTEGAPTFRQIALAPKTVASYVDMSRKLILQSSPDIEALIRDDLVTGTAVGIEGVAIDGGGSNEPTGITQTSGIGSVALGTNGLAPTWAMVANLFKEVAVDNADVGSLAYLCNPQTIAKLLVTPKIATYDAKMIMEDMKQLLGFPVGMTTNVPSDLTKGSASGTASAMIFGNFNDLIIAEWGAVDVLVDPYSGSTTGTVRVTCFNDVDVAVRHPQSFAACLDLLPA